LAPGLLPYCQTTAHNLDLHARYAYTSLGTLRRPSSLIDKVPALLERCNLTDVQRGVVRARRLWPNPAVPAKISTILADDDGRELPPRQDEEPIHGALLIVTVAQQAHTRAVGTVRASRGPALDDARQA